MISYHIFFTPKPDVSDTAILGMAHEFLDAFKSKKQIAAYRIIQVTNPASFQALPRFQAIVDYENRQDLDASFAFMKMPGNLKAGAHGRLMENVSDFKVSFSKDV